jgi:acetate---CoA ligase (ADP-forming) subunit beta
MIMKTLDFLDSVQWLEKRKINFPKYTVVKKEQELEKLKIHFPYVMKAVSTKISHKTEYNAVQVNVNELAEAQHIFRRFKRLPGFRSVIVQEQLEGFELIIGAKRDPQFGPTVLVGFGGIFTEIIKDFSIRICPITQRDADSMLKDLKAYPLLAGARKQKPANLKMIKEILLTTSNIITKDKNIQELDLNPVMANQQKAVAVDARIILG